MIDKDFGYDKMLKELRKQSTKELAIGIVGNSKLANIALYNEFGTGNIPQRSFLRSTLDEHTDDIISEYVENYKQTNNAELSNQKTGKYASRLVKRKIVTGPFTPNAPSTIKRKGRNQPLIDKGKMLNSIVSIVRDKK